MLMALLFILYTASKECMRMGKKCCFFFDVYSGWAIFYIFVFQFESFLPLCAVPPTVHRMLSIFHFLVKESG